MLEPDDKRSAVVAFLNREVRHRAVGSRAVPMLFTGLDPNRIAGMDFLHRFALELNATHSGDNVQRLPYWMRMPCRSRSGREGHHSRADARWGRRSDDLVDPDGAGEVGIGAFAAAAYLVGDDFHGESIVAAHYR